MIPGVGWLRDWQGGFYSFQVHQYQLPRDSFCTHNVKCVIGKESRHPNGFVTQSTMPPSPNHSKCTSNFLCHWSSGLWEVSSASLGISRAAQSGNRNRSYLLGFPPLPFDPPPSQSLCGHRAKGLEYAVQTAWFKERKCFGPRRHL